MKEKIKFRDLSIWLKIGVVGGIISVVSMIFSFLIGFIDGVLG